MNICEIHEMIELLEDFYNKPLQRTIVVGGIAGSFIFKHAIDAALTVYPFEKTLVVEGCQDYIGIAKCQMHNFVYYADLFTDVLFDPLQPYDPFKPVMFNPKPSYGKRLNMMMIEKYDLIIINDAHLIPRVYIDSIVKNYYGKVCIIVDPFDINGEMYTGCPTITDSLNKLSPMIGLARETYNVDTRAIDRTVKGSITESKISKRSIGKIDDKQYVTNDEYLLDLVRHKQLQSVFRKNQKLFVTSERINSNIEEGQRGQALTKNSMCVIVSASSKPLMKLRLFNSKMFCYGDVSYLDNPPENVIQVKPANILTLEESAYHRYNSTVLICNDPITQRQKYSILKNSNNITIGHI